MKSIMVIVTKLNKLYHKIFDNKIISNGLVVIVLALAAVYFCMISVLNPWSVKLPALDTAVWLRCGVGMVQGDIMYVDMWDHKGPFLFLIHYLGLKMTPHSLNGVWFLECVFLFATFIGLYLTASLLSESKVVRVLSVLGSMHGFYYYIGDGDVVEAWALPFLSFSLFFFVRYLQTKEIKKGHIFLAGSFCALSFLLNGNLISVWVAFLPVIVLNIIIKKRWEDLKWCTIYFVLGFMLVVSITVGVLVIQGSFNEFIEAYLGFNNSYIGEHSLYKYYTAIMTSVYLDSWFSYIHFGFLMLLLHQKKFDWKWSVIIYTCVTLVLLNLSGRQYHHYNMQLIPCTIIPATMITNALYIWCKNHAEFLLIIVAIFWVWVRFDVEVYTEKIVNTMDIKHDNDYAGGNLENYLIVNEWLNYRYTDEQIDKWVINDRSK